jgi:hypothetical protein
VETLDFYISPQDGWVLVSTNPSYLKIKPDFNIPWALAATTSGAPDTTGAAATGAIVFSDRPADGGTVTVGNVTYRFVEAFNNPGADDVLIGNDQAATETALAAAINGRSLIPATAATGGVLFLGGVPTASQTVTIGSEVYTFVALRAAPFQVTIGIDETTTGDNFVTALTADSTLVNGVNTAGDVALTAKTAGYAGNSITLATNADNTSVSDPTMINGNDAGPAILANTDASAAVSGSNVNLTSRVIGRAGNNTTLSENATNLTVTAFSGGSDPLVGLVYGNDEFKKFEAFSIEPPIATATTAEFYVKVSNSSGGYNQGRVRFGVIREQA